MINHSIILKLLWFLQMDKTNVYINVLVCGIMMQMVIIIVQHKLNAHQKSIHNILRQHNNKNVYKNVVMILHLIFIHNN